MKALERYGITTLWTGDYCYGLPKWARDEEGLDYAGKNLIICGGPQGFFSLPLSSIEINEVVENIIDYMAADGEELSDIEEARLREALASDTPEKLEDLGSI